MPRAGTFLYEVDLSLIVDTSTDFYTGVQLKALKGDEEKVVLFSRAQQLLRKFTANETISVGDDDSFWSALAALERSKILASRVVKNSGYSSAKIYSLNNEDFAGNVLSGNVKFDENTLTFTVLNADLTKQIQNGAPIQFGAGFILPSPLTDGTTYYIIKSGLFKFKLAATQADALASTPVPITLIPVVKSAVFTADSGTDLLTIGSPVLDDLIQTGNIATLSVSGGSLATPFQSNVKYYMIRVSSTTFKLATTLANANSNTPIDITAIGSGTQTVTVVKDISVSNIETPTGSSTVLTEAFTVNATTDVATMTADTINNLITTGSEVKFTTTDTLPAPLQPNTYYYLIEVTDGVPGFYRFAKTFDEAISNDYINLTDTGTGVHTMVTKLQTPESYSFNQDEALLFYAKTTGEHGDKLAVSITDNPKTPGTFNVSVYALPDLVTPIEGPFVCSRELNKKDGYGRNVFIENVLKRSENIGCNNNELIDGTIMPQFQVKPLRLRGGDNGDTITEGDLILDLNAKFTNRNRVPITVMIDAANNTANYQREILQLAELRGDCVGVVSMPLEAELNSSYLDAMYEYRNNTLGVNTSYGGMYTPHVKIFDPYNDREDLQVSPSGYIAALIAQTEASSRRWFPVAGKRRGVFNTITGLVREYDDAELDFIYDTLGINPIRRIEGEGIFLWGQRTLLTYASALDRMNVRLLLTVIEPAIRKLLDGYVFEFNNDATRLDITNQLNGYLNGIKNEQGIYDFLVICSRVNNSDEDIDNNLMNVWILIKPTKSAEFIPVKLALTRTSMDFGFASQLLV